MKTMNTITKTDELKEIKTQTSSTQLAYNLETAFRKTFEIIDENKYTYTRNESDWASFDYEVDSMLDERLLSMNRRKKIAKAIYFLLAKPTIKKMNSLFRILEKSALRPTRFKVKPSKKEQDIQSKRKAWVSFRDQAEKLRLEYMEEKGDFYKTK